MCGIAGVWANRLSRHDAVAAVQRMTSAQRHRGPDDAGLWTDTSGAVVLGHRRLAVIDTSAAGRQPMVTDDDKLAVSYNGEIYNYPELRIELEGLGHRFRSSSDTEVLLRGYLEWGGGVVHRIAGMFAFAIWDEVGQELFLARDRVGEKPLYYSDSGTAFTFGSELPAVAGCPWIDTEIDSDALTEYLRCGYVPSPKSIFRYISKLAPAHTLSVTRAGIRVERYWNPVEHGLSPRIDIDEEDALSELETRLSASVGSQVVSDVPIGAFLSGGVDSSLIVALMRKRVSGDVRTFTIGFGEERFDESPYAEEVASVLGTTHSVRRLGLDEAMQLADQLPTMFGEPFADPSALPTRMLAAVAREHVTVALSGDGADELFGGYDVYGRLELYERLVGLSRPFADTLLPLIGKIPGLTGRRARRLRESVKSRGVSYRSYFSAAEIEGLVKGAVRGITAEQIVWNAAGAMSFRRRAMVTDFSTYLPDDVLTKVDRACMAESLETRAPFLDHRFVEWATRLPDRFVDGKYLLKKLLEKYIPAKLVHRPKSGFDVPIRDWLRSDLGTRLRDEIASDSFLELGLDHTGLIDRLLREHISGIANHARRLWILFVLTRWHAEFVANRNTSV